MYQITIAVHACFQRSSVLAQLRPDTGWIDLWPNLVWLTVMFTLTKLPPSTVSLTKFWNISGTSWYYFHLAGIRNTHNPNHPHNSLGNMTLTRPLTCYSRMEPFYERSYLRNYAATTYKKLPIQNPKLHIQAQTVWTTNKRTIPAYTPDYKSSQLDEPLSILRHWGSLDKCTSAEKNHNSVISPGGTRHPRQVQVRSWTEVCTALLRVVTAVFSETQNQGLPASWSGDCQAGVACSTGRLNRFTSTCTAFTAPSETLKPLMEE